MAFSSSSGLWRVSGVLTCLLCRKCPELEESVCRRIEVIVKELSHGKGSGFSSLQTDDKTGSKSENGNSTNGNGQAVGPIEKLKSGFAQFKTFYNKEEALFKQLAQGQQPKWMIIACSDSRVDPALILNLGLGEAFVVRNIASVVPHPLDLAGAATSSAIEYAILHLKVEHLMVIGHSRCGGIKALMGSKEDGSNKFSEYIEDWMSSARIASKKAIKLNADETFEMQCSYCEKEAVNTSLSNCLSFPFIKEAVQQNKLTLHGGHYDFVHGTFDRWTIQYNISDPEHYE